MYWNIHTKKKKKKTKWKKKKKHCFNHLIATRSDSARNTFRTPFPSSYSFVTTRDYLLCRTKKTDQTRSRRWTSVDIGRVFGRLDGNTHTHTRVCVVVITRSGDKIRDLCAYSSRIVFRRLVDDALSGSQELSERSENASITRWLAPGHDFFGLRRKYTRTRPFRSGRRMPIN